MDWMLTSLPDLAQTLGVTLPSGFGYEFAGVVDEVGDYAEGLAVGDRVCGGAIGRPAAD
jgi:NADPH:quinone reductase-like Zn-dependent oxidoreductase